MKADEHTAIIQEIAKNLTDQAKVTDLLTTLSNDYKDTLGSIEKLSPLAEQNELLRQANMKLFLQVGEQPKDEPKPQDKPNQPQSQGNEELSFDKLFNENGGLK